MPRGARFFEDVLPPAGWEWADKKWTLDLWSREWVEERIITAVEVETEGERWVYDMWDEREDAAAAEAAAAAGVGPIVGAAGDAGGGGDGHSTTAATSTTTMPNVSWEESEEGMGRRGQWRRRRWVRLVRRKTVASAES